MKIVQVPNDRRVRLPKQVFKPAEKIVLIREGSTVTIKKLEPPRLSTLARRVKERPLPMRAIVREVHAYRRAKRV
jgi:virulence-associated protein VagC